jgi:hypothetical protein
MKLQIIELEAQDDRASVRDRLAWSQAPRVVLVFPNRGRTRLTRLDLVLLHRQAAQRGRELALVTRHPLLQSAAEAAGIPHFPSIDHVPEAEWPHARPNPSALVQPAESHHSGELPPRPAATIPRPSRGVQRWGWLGVAAISLFALAAAVVPSADIVLVPINETRQAMIALKASPSSPDGQPTGFLASRQVEVELEDTLRLPATGTALAPDSSARGEALFTNLSADPAAIPEGTSVRSSGHDQLRFITTVVAELPAGQGSTVSIPITAAQAGGSANLPAESLDSIDGPLGLLASVSNPQDLSGGSDRSQAAVAQADLLAVQRALEDQLLQQAGTALLDELQQGERLLPGSLRVVAVLDRTFDHAPGDLASSIGLRQQVRIGGLAAQQADLEAAVWRSIEAAPEEDWLPGRPSLAIDEITAGEDEGSGPNVKARWTVYRPLDRARLARAISGRSVDEADRILRGLAELAEIPQIRVHPSWLSRMPWIDSRIRLTSPWDGP